MAADVYNMFLVDLYSNSVGNLTVTTVAVADIFYAVFSFHIYELQTTFFYTRRLSISAA